MNFICKSKPIPGKVIIEKIKELGIPNKFIAKILEAESFILPNTDKVIMREEIQEKSKPGPAFIILHIN
jgi:hypothetical protein